VVEHGFPFEEDKDEAMFRSNMGVRALALTAVVLGSLLCGCGEQGDPTKEPNKNLKAGPPSAEPGLLKQIQEHQQQNNQQQGQR